MLLGTFNSSLWDDNGGLEKGEVVRLSMFFYPFFFVDR